MASIKAISEHEKGPALCEVIRTEAPSSSIKRGTKAKRLCMATGSETFSKINLPLGRAIKGVGPAWGAGDGVSRFKRRSPSL